MNNNFKSSFNWASSQNVKQQHAKCNLVPALELYKLIKLLTQCLRHWQDESLKQIYVPLVFTFAL